MRANEAAQMLGESQVDFMTGRNTLLELNDLHDRESRKPGECRMLLIQVKLVPPRPPVSPLFAIITMTSEMSDEKTAMSSLNDDVKQINENTKEDGIPTSELEELERWNGSRTSICRYLATLFSFIVMGTYLPAKIAIAIRVTENRYE